MNFQKCGTFQPAWNVISRPDLGQYYNLKDSGDKVWVTHVGGTKPDSHDARYVGIVTKRSIT